MVASMIHTFPLLNVTSQETAPSKDMGLWFKKNDMGNIFAPAFILTHQIFDTVPRHLFAVGIEHGYKPFIIRRRWHGIPLLYPDLIVAGSHLLAYTRTFSAMPNRKVFEKKVKNFQFSSSTVFDNAM